MALNIEHKKALVAQVNKVASQALSAVVAEYQGLNVEQMIKLYKQARDNGIYLRIVRNTLAKRALEDTNFFCMQNVLVGPVILAFSCEDPGAAARLFKDFSKENTALVIKALSIGGQLLNAEKIDVLAKIPTMDQARAQLMSVMIAPVTGLVTAISDILSKIVRVLAAVADQKKNEKV